MTLIDTVVSGNSATDTAAGGGGVGIDSGTFTLVDSTIRDNTAAGRGGGIITWAWTVEIVDSIVRDNTASRGGGIYNLGARARYPSVGRAP